MTDGTAASKRTTGTTTRRSPPGENSTMKIAARTEKARPMRTANPVVRMVPQMSGHAPSWKSADLGLAPVLTWLPIWTSTSPLPVNHDRPLCWNDGQARTATKTIISTITSRTTDASAPSVRSARRSDHGSLSRSSIYLRGTQ